MAKEPIRYRETQVFPLALILTGALCALYVTGNTVDGGYAYVFGELRFYLVLLLFLSPVVFWGSMTVQVTDTDFSIGFGLLPFRRRVIPLTDITDVEPVHIKWLRDFRFVGTTYGRDTGTVGYFVRYGSGVRVSVSDTTAFIGSRRHAVLAQALKTAVRDARRSMVAG